MKILIPVTVAAVTALVFFVRKSRRDSQGAARAKIAEIRGELPDWMEAIRELAKNPAMSQEAREKVGALETRHSALGSYSDEAEGLSVQLSRHEGLKREVTQLHQEMRQRIDQVKLAREHAPSIYSTLLTKIQRAEQAAQRCPGSGNIRQSLRLARESFLQASELHAEALSGNVDALLVFYDLVKDVDRWCAECVRREEKELAEAQQPKLASDGV